MRRVFERHAPALADELMEFVDRTPDRPSVFDNPSFRKWAGTDNVVLNASVGGNDEWVARVIEELRYKHRKSSEWLEISGSRQRHQDQAAAMVNKWFEILGHDDAATTEEIEEHLEEALDAGIIPFTGSKSEALASATKEAGDEWDLYESRVTDAEKELLAIDSVYQARHAFETGKPVVAITYHGSNTAGFDAFSDEALGSNTGAGSAMIAHFSAGSPDTAESYIGGQGSLAWDRYKYKDELIEIVSERFAEDHREGYLSDELVEEFGGDPEDENWWPDSDAVSDHIASNPVIYQDEAESIADYHGDTDFEWDGSDVVRPAVYKLFVKFENPMVVDQEGRSYRERTYREMLEEASEKGHDGLIILNTYDQGKYGPAYATRDNIFAVFDEENIKSATGNSGDFESGDPRITRSLLKSSDCGANAPGGGGFQRGNDCASRRNTKDGKPLDFVVSEPVKEDGGIRYSITPVVDGKEAGHFYLDVWPDDDRAFVHANVMADFRRQGIATEAYRIANSIAGKHGVSVEASDSLSDSASLLWDHFEEQGFSDGWVLGSDFQSVNTRASGDKEKKIPQTDTPEFKKWFGNSVTKDANWVPQVFYHATVSDFKEFDATIDGVRSWESKDGKTRTLYGDSGRAYWFSDRADMTPAAHNVGDLTGEGSSLVPVYLKMERPLYIVGNEERKQAVAKYAEGFSEFPFLLTEEAIENVRKDGFDSIILSPSSGSNEYIVFDPTQIKSATGNEGAFNPSNPDIRKSLSRSVGAVSDCGANAPGGGGFQPGNTCAAGNGGRKVGERRPKRENPRNRKEYGEAKDEFFKIPMQFRGAVEENYHKGGKDRELVRQSAIEEGLDPDLIFQYLELEKEVEEFSRLRSEDELLGPEFIPDVSGNHRTNPQTATREFKDWFGDSKMVNEDGSPRVFFHGTRADFKEFMIPSEGLVNEVLGVHVAKDPQMTDAFTVGTYARNSSAWGPGDEAIPTIEEFDQHRYIKPGGSVMPVYVRMEKPFIQPNYGGMDQFNIRIDVYGEIFKESREAFVHYLVNTRNVDRAVADAAYAKLKANEPVSEKDGFGIDVPQKYIDKYGDGFRAMAANYSPEFCRNYQGQDWTVWSANKYRDILKSRGYDGIIYENTSNNEIGFEGKIDHTAYIVFDPDQVKSATGNRGTFDRNDPNITKSLSKSSGCGANAPGGGGFQRGNTCAKGNAPEWAIHRTTPASASSILNFGGFDLGKFGSGAGAGAGEPAGVYLSLPDHEKDFAQEVRDRGLHEFSAKIYVKISPETNVLNWDDKEMRHADQRAARMEYLKRDHGLEGEEARMVAKGSVGKMKRHPRADALLAAFDDMVSANGDRRESEVLRDMLMDRGYDAVEWKDAFRGVRQFVVMDLDKIERTRREPPSSMKSTSKSYMPDIRDGDGDGFIYDGTKYERPAPENTDVVDETATDESDVNSEVHPASTHWIIETEQDVVREDVQAYVDDLSDKPSIVDVVEYLQSIHGVKIDTGKESGLTEEEKEWIAQALYQDAMHGYSQKVSGDGWYKKDIDETMRILTEMDPDLGDKRHQFVLKAAIALLSNGQDVDTNLRDAFGVYQYWKTQGGLDGGIITSNEKFGNQTGAINKSTELFDAIVAKVGYDDAMEFFTGEMLTPKELHALGMEMLPALAKRKYSDKTGKEIKGESPFEVKGELGDEKVPAFAIFGPKVGSFFANLNGNFDTVTMDRWFMRSWGRTTGEAYDVPPAKVIAESERLISLIDKGLTPEETEGYDMREVVAGLREAIDTGKVTIDNVAYRWAADRTKSYAASENKDGGGYGDKTPVNLAANGFQKILSELSLGSPRGGSQRRTIRDVMGRVLEKVRQSGHSNVNLAELQAVLWFHEKRLYRHLGARVDISEEDDSFSRSAKRLRDGDVKPREVKWQKTGNTEKTKKSKKKRPKKKSGSVPAMFSARTNRTSTTNGSKSNRLRSFRARSRISSERNDPPSKVVARLMRRVGATPTSKHMGPGPHPSGSPQSVHGNRLEGENSAAEFLLGRRRGSMKVLGAMIRRDISDDKPVSLIGKSIKSVDDLVELAQVYRDPRYETFRAFFLKNGEVIGQNAYSSRMPSVVEFPSDFHEGIYKDVSALGADQLFVLHNHPSGNPNPSREDMAVTNDFYKRYGDKFIGHGVIDHNKAAVMDQSGLRFVAIENDDLNDFAKAEVPNEVLGAKIKDVDSLTQIAMKCSIQEDRAVVVFTTSPGLVSGVLDIDQASLEQENYKVFGAIRRMSRRLGSGGNRFLVIPSEKDFEDYIKYVEDGYFTDIASADGVSTLRSVHTVSPGKDRAGYDEGKLVAMERKSMPDIRDGDGDGFIYDGTEWERPAPVQARFAFDDRFDPDPRYKDRMTESPAFKRWFGESKVVDEDGNPLVVYHGTDADFDEFDPNQLGHTSILFSTFEHERHGFFFAEKPELAADYGRNVMELYLLIENPADFTSGGDGWDILLDELEESGINRRWVLGNNTWELFDEDDGKHFVSVLKKLGYDGAKIWEDRYDEDGKHIGTEVAWVAFDPDQIKSAKENTGSFNPYERNIKKSQLPMQRSTAMVSDCGANAPGGGGFQPGNTCASGEGGSRAASTKKRVIDAFNDEVVETSKRFGFTDRKEADLDEIEVDQLPEELIEEFEAYRDEAIRSIAENYAEDAQFELSEDDKTYILDDNGYSVSDLADEALELGYSQENVDNAVSRADNGLEFLEYLDSEESVSDEYWDFHLKEKMQEVIGMAWEEQRQEFIETRIEELIEELSNTETDRIFKEWLSENEDEVRTAVSFDSDDVWYTDGDGDLALQFEASNGQRYVVNAVDLKLEGEHKTRDIQFGNQSGQDRFGVTKTGAASEVFTNVLAAIYSLHTKDPSEIMSFTAREESRRRLYDKIVKRLAGLIPEYRAVAINKHISEVRQYVIAKRDHEMWAKLEGKTYDMLVKSQSKKSLLDQILDASLQNAIDTGKLDDETEVNEEQSETSEKSAAVMNDCGANAPGGGGFQPGNTCGSRSSKKGRFGGRFGKEIDEAAESLTIRWNVDGKERSRYRTFDEVWVNGKSQPEAIRNALAEIANEIRNHVEVFDGDPWWAEQSYIDASMTNAILTAKRIDEARHAAQRFLRIKKQWEYANEVPIEEAILAVDVVPDELIQRSKSLMDEYQSHLEILKSTEDARTSAISDLFKRHEAGEFDKSELIVRVKAVGEQFKEQDDARQEVLTKVSEIAKEIKREMYSVTKGNNPEVNVKLLGMKDLTMEWDNYGFLGPTQESRVESARYFFGAVLNRDAWGDEYEIGAFPHSGTRAKYVPKYGAYFFDEYDEDSVHVHEFAHSLEYQNPAVMLRAEQFREMRVRRSGTDDVPMSEFGDGYKDDEVGNPDQFAKAVEVGLSRTEDVNRRAAYIGKRYSDGATEVISMGSEQMYERPGVFARQDEEYFKFMLGVYTGQIVGVYSDDRSGGGR